MAAWPRAGVSLAFISIGSDGAGVQVPNEETAAASPPALPVDPGLCGGCRHASVKATHRGTAYLRCTRSAWDERLPKYPRLPVRDCPGFARADG